MAQTSTPELVNDVLVSLRKLDFQKSKEIIDLNRDTSLASALEYLIELKQLNTYRAENKVKLESGIPFTKTTLISLNELINGYENLYLNNRRIIAVNHFIMGLETAIENQEAELIKSLIIGIFIVKQSGYSLADPSSYFEYLQIFEKNITNEIDTFWFHYYKIILLDITIGYGEKLNDEQIQEYKEHLKALYQKGGHNNQKLNLLYNKEMGDFALEYDPYNAIKYFIECENLLEPISYFDVFRFRLKLDKALAYSEMEKYRRAIDTIVANKGLIQIGNRMTNNLNYNFFLSKIYYKNGATDSAYFHLNRLFNLEKKSNYNKINEAVSAIEVELDTEKKEKQIIIEQQRATKNRNWLIAATLALIFGSGIAILLQKNTAKKRQLAEQKAQLEQQKVESLLKEQELLSIDAMIAGQEKERQKVANELHDDLGSLMATVKLHFENVKVDEKDPAMKNAQNLLEKAYQKIRGMAHSKNSGVMANQGLLPAVKKMAKIINATNSLNVSVEDFGLADRMENSLELTIFRIIQELVANIIKHAEATKANIQFTQHEDKLNIIVEDNGKGFDMSVVNRNESGMGIGSIEKRIEHLEGSFTVDSVLGKGTSILIDIPV